MLKHKRAKFFWLFAGSLAAGFLLSSQASAASHWPLVGEPLPDSIMNNYGDFQAGWVPFNNGDSAFERYLHSGLDIFSDTLHGVIASDSGFLRFKEYTGRPGDTAYYAIGLGLNKGGDGPGWMYTHVDPSIVANRNYGFLFGQDSLFTRVWFFPSRQNPTHPHLHFERVWAWGLGVIHPGGGFLGSPGGGEPRILASNLRPEWDVLHVFRIANPLEYLEDKSDTIPPWLGVLPTSRSTPFYLKRDSSEAVAYPRYRKVYRPYDGGGGYQRDSMFIVNRKADVSAWATDHIRNHTWLVGIYKLVYVVHGVNGQVIQQPKGFLFTGRTLEPSIEDSAKSRLIANRAYDLDSTIANSKYVYQISNADSLVTDFDSVDVQGLHYVPEALQGYWSTRQHKDRAWNEDESATQDSARFRDGYYWVKVQAWDSKNNTDMDSLKVIINNFPPKVKQTYPDSGELGVPRGCTLQVWFDQPMDTASAKSGFRLHLAGDTTSIQGTAWFLNQSDTLMYFKPTNPLGLDAAYVMTISSATKDIADSTMGADYEAWFSTAQRDLHVCYGNYGVGEVRIEVRNNRFRYPPRQTYAEYSSSGYSLWGQKIALDEAGNRYLAEEVTFSGVARLAKYDTSGALVDSFLLYRKSFSVTTDGDTLFASLPVDSNRTNITNRIIGLSLTGDSLTSWRSPDSVTFEDIGYSPVANKIFTLSWGWKKQDTLPTSPWVIRNLTLNRYTKVGQLETTITIPINSPPSYKPFRMVVGKSRVYVARVWYYGPYARGDTVVMYDWNLSDLGRFAAGDGGPGCTYRRVNSMTVDKWNLYALLKSTNAGANDPVYYWVHVFTPTGSHVRSCSLLTRATPTNEGYSALAVYPSVLDTAGGFTEGGGGIGDGGPQTAGVNALLPRVFALGPSRPNPTRVGVRIDYALPKESLVSLKVYNVAGQLVRTLREGKEKPGYFVAEWDGKDQVGHRVSSGVYLYRMEAGEFRKTRKLVVVR